MTNQTTRRGKTQEVVNENCHSKFNLESHHVLLSKVRSRIKYGMTALFNNGNNEYVENPQLQPSGMTSLYDTPLPGYAVLSPQGGQKPSGMIPHFINGKCTTRGFMLRPSSSRSVSMRDIGATREALNKNAFRAPLRSGFTARSVTPQCRYAGYSGRIGFTLIELLVVVLIIGILAAIALPQYNKAVIKSRLAAIRPIMAAIKNAEESYYLANGQYTRDLSALDINTSCRIVSDTSVFACDNYFAVDVIDGNSSYQSNLIRAYYCSNGSTSWSSCLNHKDFIYIVWLDHSSYPGKHECTPYTTLGTQICETLQ